MVGTFHAISLKNQPGVCLLDQSESLALAEMAAGEIMSPEGLLRAVSMEKNGLPVELSEAEQKACDTYQAMLAERGAMDFDDLLLAELARAEGAADKDLRSFTHLLVDEFQDCDPIQYRLLRAWNRPGPVHLRLPGRGRGLLAAPGGGLAPGMHRPPDGELPLPGGDSPLRPAGH